MIINTNLPAQTGARLLAESTTQLNKRICHGDGACHGGGSGPARHEQRNQTAMLAQANSMPQSVLKLLQ